MYVCTFCAAVFSGWCSHCTCVHSVQQFFQDGVRIVHVYILCSSFTRMVLALYVCTSGATVFLGWCSHCTCVHSVQQFYQDGAHIVHVYIRCNNFFRMVLTLYILCSSFFRMVLTLYMCTFGATVLPGRCLHCTCVHSVQQFYQDGARIVHYVHSVQQFYQDGARIEAAFRKYFHRADPEQKGDSVEVIICHANVIRYFVCR